MTAAVLASLTTLVPAQGHDGLHFVMPWRWYHRLAACETSHELHHSTRNYTGVYGLNRQTVNRWTGHTTTDGLDAYQQAHIVDQIAFLGSTVNGEHVWPVGPWGFGSVRANCQGLADLICESHKPAVRYWRRHCK